VSADKAVTQAGVTSGRWGVADRQRLVRIATFLFVAAGAALILSYFHDQFWWPPDEGGSAHRADRLLSGEVLNRDFQDIRPGYANFVNAAALWLFGGELVSLRYPLAALGLVQAGLIYFLLLPRGILLAGSGAIALTALSFVQFLDPAAHWYCLALAIGVIGALAWMPREGRARLIAVGFLVIAIFLFRQLTGIFVAMGVLTYLLCEAPPGENGRERALARLLVAVMAAGLVFYLLRIKDPFAFVMFGIGPLALLVWVWFNGAAANRYVLGVVPGLALGGMIAWAPLLIYHLAHGSLGYWLDDTVLSAFRLTGLDFVRQMSFVLYMIQGARQIIAFESVAAVLNGLFWLLLPLAPAGLAGFLFLRLRRPGARGDVLHPLPILALFYALVSVHFQITIYLFYSAGLTLAALLWLTGAGARHGGTRQGSGLKALAPALLTLAVSAVGLYYQAGQPVTRGFAGIVAGERVDLVPAEGLERHGLRIEAAEAELYRHLLTVIEREVPPEGAILAVPANPELYFLSRRRNPTRYFNLAVGLRDEDEITRLLEALEDAPPTLVFHHREDKYNTPHTDALMAFVRKRYEVIDSRGDFDIYRYAAGR
jgi:hypothetical protein